MTLIRLVGIPVTNLSANPARSTGPALFAGGWAIQQLWLFWLAPIIGGVLAGAVYRELFGEESAPCGVRSTGAAVRRVCSSLIGKIRVELEIGSAVGTK